MSKRHIFLFWGAMDLMYVLGFIYWNLSRGRIPVYDDVISFVHVDVAYGGSMPQLLFFSGLLLNFSIILTVFIFFKQHRFAGLVAYLQMPLRLFLVVPSLSFISGVVNLFGLKQVAIIFILLMATEVLKIASLWRGLARQ